MLSQRVRGTLEIPGAWKELLEIEEFSDDVPKKPTMGVPDPFDILPYRDDYREVSVVDGDTRVSAVLCSGSNNYWLMWIIDCPGCYYESDPEHDLPSSCIVDIEAYVDDDRSDNTIMCSFIVNVRITNKE